jgi:hypothetical protein
MSKVTFPWRVAAALTGLAWVTALLALPQPPPATVVALAIVVPAVVVLLGLRIGRTCGLGAPLIEAVLYPSLPSRSLGPPLVIAALAGAGLGAGVLLALRFGLAAAVPQLTARLASEAGVAAWKRWLIAFDSAVLEEMMFRLLLVTGLVVLARHAATVSSGPGPRWTLALPVVIVAGGFAAAHLRPWLAVASPTPALVGGVLLLNAAGGLVFGWLYVTRGIEAAMVAHFVADVLLHVPGPVLLGLSALAAN